MEMMKLLHAKVDRLPDFPLSFLPTERWQYWCGEKQSFWMALLTILLDYAPYKYRPFLSSVGSKIY